MLKKKSIAVLALVVAALGGGAFGVVRYERTHAKPDIQFKTQSIAKTRIEGKVTATGTLSAVVTVQVGTQVSGRVSQLMADFNTQVKKNQVIAKLDPQLFEAAVEQALANYNSAKANDVKAQSQVVQAERQFERQKALNAQGLVTKADLDSAETDAAVARANVDVNKASTAQALASLNQARVNLSYTTIVSPIDGIVISRSVDVGQTVAASLQAPVIFTIAEDLKNMQVITKVAEGDVGRLTQGAPAYFTVDAFPGQRFRGTIEQIRNAATTTQNVVTYDAVIVVKNDDLRLRPGMTANVTVIYAQRDDVLALPNAALRFKAPASLSSANASSSASVSTGTLATTASGNAPNPATSGSGDGAPGAAPSGGRHPRDGGAGGGWAGGGSSRSFGGSGAKAISEDTPRTVWVLRNGQPVPVTVKVGLSDGTVSEVTEGDLHEGDAVVVESTGGDSAPATSSTSKNSGPPGGGPPGGGGPGGGGLRRMF